MIYSRCKYYRFIIQQKPSNINTIERPLLQNRSILQELFSGNRYQFNLYEDCMCWSWFRNLDKKSWIHNKKTPWIILMFIFRCSVVFTVCFVMIHVFSTLSHSRAHRPVVAVLRRAGQEFHRHSRGDGRWGEGSGYQGGWAEDPGHFGDVMAEPMGKYGIIWGYIYI